jgi:hypothetical protein
VEENDCAREIPCEHDIIVWYRSGFSGFVEIEGENKRHMEPRSGSFAEPFFERKSCTPKESSKLFKLFMFRPDGPDAGLVKIWLV